MKDVEERVYYDDSKTKVTASFVAGYKQIILPIERITDVIVTHKSFSMYFCFIVCVLLLTALVVAPFSGTFLPFEIQTEYVWYYFMPVFGVFCIWFRFIYENYVELHVELNDGKRHLLRVITLGKRTVVYDIADAIRAAMGDYHSRSEAELMQDTDSMKIRRLRNMLIQSNLDMTPEIMSILNADPEMQKKYSAAQKGV